MKHACPDLVREAVYGLPEVNRDAITQGAHRRAIRAATRPRCSSDFCRCSKPAWSTREHLIADCKSGVSGAGRKAEIGTRCSPRRPTTSRRTASTGHRHIPEIVAGLERDRRDSR